MAALAQRAGVFQDPVELAETAVDFNHELEEGEGIPLALLVLQLEGLQGGLKADRLIDRKAGSLAPEAGEKPQRVSRPALPDEMGSEIGKPSPKILQLSRKGDGLGTLRFSGVDRHETLGRGPQIPEEGGTLAEGGEPFTPAGGPEVEPGDLQVVTPILG